MFSKLMAKGASSKQSANSSRQISHTRLHDDAALELRYERLNKLGEGSFGTVYRVRSKENETFYAMKTIQKKPGNPSKALFLDNEVKLLTEVNHPNLIQLHEVLETSQNLYLAIDLCEGGELGGYVKKNGPLPEPTIKRIMAKLIDALYYLHKMDIVHRDLKLENILLKNSPTSKTDEFDIRVTDFGLSSKKSITNTDSLFNDYCGTPLYMAPEILENKNYSALCDVWAMGVIMYYLICGRHPFVANDERRVLELIRSQKLRYDSEKFRHLSSTGLEFLQGMLVYDTVHRRTMGELIAHPWLTGDADRGPTKDIITMMKEFQAENDQRQQILAEQSAAALVISTPTTPPPPVSVSTSSGSSDSKTSKQDKIPENLPELPLNRVPTKKPSTIASKKSFLERNTKANGSSNEMLRTPRRSVNLLSDPASSTTQLKMKQTSTMADLTSASSMRYIAHSPSPASPNVLTKLRPNRARLGRSQSQSIVPLSSRYPCQVEQRPIFQDSIDLSFANASPLNPSSSTATALMMINKQYTHQTTLLPIANASSTKNNAFYEKRHSNFA